MSYIIFWSYSHLPNSSYILNSVSFELARNIDDEHITLVNIDFPRSIVTTILTRWHR